MKKRWVRILIALFVLVAVGGGAYSFLSIRPILVAVAEPEKDVSTRVFGLGTIEVQVVSKIGFEISGVLTELALDHGDTVSKGKLLARLHTKEQEAKVARTEANVDRARSILALCQETNKRQKTLAKRRIVSEQKAQEAKSEENIASTEIAIALQEV